VEVVWDVAGGGLAAAVRQVAGVAVVAEPATPGSVLVAGSVAAELAAGVEVFPVDGTPGF
jgi:hypothetical protein